MIARPEPVRGTLFVKLAHVPIAAGEQVFVDEGDAAVFVRDGATAGLLGAGTYRIEKSGGAPFFASLLGDSVDVVFVRIIEHGWWQMSAEPYTLVDGRTGASSPVRFTGSFSVEVIDPREFATTMAVQDEKWLWAYVESVVDRACRDVASKMMTEGLGVHDLISEGGARLLGLRTIADVAHDLAGKPLRVARFGSLVVEVLPG
jgi:membrane protease subunit (stomatin/prohibitin family)